MKKLTARLFLVFSALLVSQGIMPIEANASTYPKRNYNCRMPERRPQGPSGQVGPSYESRHLFDNLGLSMRQYGRLDKSYIKYRRDMDKYAQRTYADPRRAEHFRLEAIKRENSFLNEVRRSLNPSQYRAFETRFVSMVPRRPSDSAPRPGSSVGPMMPGPAPTIMTNGRR